MDTKWFYGHACLLAERYGWRGRWLPPLDYRKNAYEFIKGETTVVGYGRTAIAARFQAGMKAVAQEQLERSQRGEDIPRNFSSGFELAPPISSQLRPAVINQRLLSRYDPNSIESRREVGEIKSQTVSLRYKERSPEQLLEQEPWREDY